MRPLSVEGLQKLIQEGGYGHRTINPHRPDVITLQSVARFYVIDYTLQGVSGNPWYHEYKEARNGETTPFDVLSEAVEKAKEIKASGPGIEHVWVRSYHRQVHLTRELLSQEAFDYLEQATKDWDPSPYNEVIELLADGKVMVRPEYTINVVGGEGNEVIGSIAYDPIVHQGSRYNRFGELGTNGVEHCRISNVDGRDCVVIRDFVQPPPDIRDIKSLLPSQKKPRAPGLSM